MANTKSKRTPEEQAAFERCEEKAREVKEAKRERDSALEDIAGGDCAVLLGDDAQVLFLVRSYVGARERVRRLEAELGQMQAEYKSNADEGEGMSRRKMSPAPARRASEPRGTAATRASGEPAAPADESTRYYRLQDVQKMFGVSRKTLKRWIYSGKISAVKLGIPREEWGQHGGAPWKVSHEEIENFKRRSESAT